MKEYSLEDLSSKQQQLIRLLIYDQKPRIEAYREVYPKSKALANDVVSNEVSRMVGGTGPYKKNPRFSIVYKKLLEEYNRKHQEKALWTREKAVKELMWVIEESRQDINTKGIKQANSNAFINAIKELNDLEGVGEERELKNQKIRSELSASESTEEQLKKYFDALDGVLDE